MDNVLQVGELDGKRRVVVRRLERRTVEFANKERISTTKGLNAPDAVPLAPGSGLHEHICAAGNDVFVSRSACSCARKCVAFIGDLAFPRLVCLFI